uniref:Uncharacterized protein n=1 Tax=Arundo donax TaxID=35708 RepID=A0A0A8YHK9_ARUDO
MLLACCWHTACYYIILDMPFLSLRHVWQISTLSHPKRQEPLLLLCHLDLFSLIRLSQNNS